MERLEYIPTWIELEGRNLILVMWMSYDQNFYLVKLMIKTSICLNLDYSSKIWSDQIVLDMGQKISIKYSFMIKTSIYSNIEYIVLDV